MIINKKHDSILIYRLGSLGDTVIALPAFHAIKKACPNSRITLLTNSPLASKAAPVESVLGSDYFFQDVLNYPLRTRDPWILLKLLFAISRKKIDCAINLNAFRSDFSIFRDQAFFRMAGVKSFYGFKLSEKDKRPNPDPRSGEVEGEASRLARRVASISQVNLDDEQFWDLRLKTEEHREAESILAKVSNQDKLIALSIGTKVQSKDWGITNWVELSSRLSGRLRGWSPVFIGSSDESEQSEACLSLWGQRGLNLCGKSSPRVSAAILAKCKVFIGHDSGPMHLASCVGVPCVAIFSARNLPRQWFPRGNKNVILYNKTECAGCGLEVCISQQKKCLTTISVNQVEEAVLSQLQTIVL
jgi:ADP-heptose:LPS heptosyltransferase